MQAPLPRRRADCHHSRTRPCAWSPHTCQTKRQQRLHEGAPLQTRFFFFLCLSGHLFQVACRVDLGARLGRDQPLLVPVLNAPRVVDLALRARVACGATTIPWGRAPPRPSRVAMEILQLRVRDRVTSP